MKILLLTTHIFSSKHRAGFHYLAEEFQKMGHVVYFCTVPNTPFHLLVDLVKNRSQIVLRVKSFFSCIHAIKYQGIFTTSYFSLIFNNPRRHYLSKLKKFLFSLGICFPITNQKFDLIIFESSACLFLFQHLKKLNPHGFFIYRVSDPLFLMNSDPLLLEEERQRLEQFDHVSVPNEHIGTHLRTLKPHARIEVLPHGINKSLLDQARLKPNPFKTNYNFVFVGMFLFDQEFLEIAARVRPDYNFHLIGFFSKKIQARNIHYYGVIPFEETLPYLAQSNAALLCRRTESQTEMVAKSLKYFQYLYLGKAMVAPKEMGLNEPFIFNYDLSDSSIGLALDNALAFNNSKFISPLIDDWSTVAAKLLKTLQSN